MESPKTDPNCLGRAVSISVAVNMQEFAWPDEMVNNLID
jgi:hypothetical protein